MTAIGRRSDSTLFNQRYVDVGYLGICLGVDSVYVEGARKGVRYLISERRNGEGCTECALLFNRSVLTCALSASISRIMSSFCQHQALLGRVLPSLSKMPIASGIGKQFSGYYNISSSAFVVACPKFLPPVMDGTKALMSSISTALGTSWTFWTI